MKATLRKAINNWIGASTYFLGTKQIGIFANPIKNGEYCIVLEKIFEINMEKWKKKVSYKKKLYTVAQNDSDFNEAGDVFRFKQISNTIDSEFDDQITKAIDLKLKNIRKKPKKIELLP